VQQVVAASGTALTSQQLKQLSGLAKKVVLAFDSDRAGLAATRRAVPLAHRLGLRLYALHVEGAKDADELIKRDPKLWQQAVSEAKEIREYWLDRGIGEFDLNSPLGKVQFIERMVEVARLYADAGGLDDDAGIAKSSEVTNIEQDSFIASVTERAGIDEADLRKAMRAEGKSVQSGAAKNQTENTNKNSVRAVVQTGRRPDGRHKLEELVLSIAISYPDTRAILGDLSGDDFDDETYRLVFEAVKGRSADSGEQMASALTNLTKDINILLLVGEQQMSSLDERQRGLEAFELARRLHGLSNREKMQSLIKQLHEAEKLDDRTLSESLTQRIQRINEEEV